MKEEVKPRLYFHADLMDRTSIKYNEARGRGSVVRTVLDDVLFIVRKPGVYGVVEYGEPNQQVPLAKRFESWREAYKSIITKAHYGCSIPYNIKELQELDVYVDSNHIPSLQLNLEYQFKGIPDKSRSEFEILDPSDIRDLLTEFEVYDVKELEGKEIYVYHAYGPAFIGAISRTMLDIKEHLSKVIKE